MSIALYYLEPIKDLPSWLIALLFFGPFAIGLTLYFYKTRHAKSWKKGIFPNSLKPTEDNYLEAYLALGARLILLNYSKSKGQTKFINDYFNRYFKSSNYNFGDSLLFSMHHPIQPNTITDWINMHNPNKGGRSQLLFFLTGLALINGKLEQNELKFLMLITQYLELEMDELDQSIEIYTSYFEARNEAKENEKTQNNSNLNNYKILNIPSNASMDQIKTAYRKMVKLHHPDRFENGTAAQKQLAKDTFLQIQKAYETLIKKGVKTDSL